jgi:hypothetical protein
MSTRQPRALILAAMLWLVVVAAGIGGLWAYAGTPAPDAGAPAAWPTSSRLSRSAELPTLVMLAHPLCSCSRASLSELARLMTHLQGRVTAHVAFYRPPDVAAGWEVDDLWRIAEAIPGVQVSTDTGGELHAFGAAASGQALVYAADGRLLFAGGLTPARGHEGDNAGRRAVESLVVTGESETHTTPVFGCLLQGGR